jgi:hypothetical protein
METAVRAENIAMLEFVGIKIIGIIIKNTKISIDFVIFTIWQFFYQKFLFVKQKL